MPAAQAESAKLLIDIPVAVHRRAKIVAKKICSNMAQIARDGLIERLNHLEENLKKEAEQAHQDKLAEKEKRRALHLVGKSPMAPLKPQSLDPLDPKRPDTEETDDAIYLEHAGRILACINSPLDVRQRVSEAIAAVQKHWPLTHPTDAEIIATLERIVVRLRGEVPAPPPVIPTMAGPAESHGFVARMVRVFDDLVGVVVDPKKIKSHGDTAPLADVESSASTKE